MNEWVYLLNLGLAIALSLVIGIEREYHQKQAGIRTHTLVGLGAALFMVISKYGFFDLLNRSDIALDPSRMAAQIVSGVGFLGGGLIFVRRDIVRGLTTAASVWLVAAVGAAAGAGMYVVAPAVTMAYLLVALGIRPLSLRMPHAKGTQHDLKIRYLDGQGLLRQIVAAVAEHGMKISNLRILDALETEDGRYQDIVLKVDGSPRVVNSLVVDLGAMKGITEIGLDRENSEG